jgi:ATP/maltotriose-dependent transcriptional regulator MalT
LLVEECLALSREIGFKEGIAASFCLSGHVAWSQGDFAAARSLTEKSLALYTEMGHKHGTAEALRTLGKVMATQGDTAAARPLCEESLLLSTALGEQWMVAACLVNLGEIAAAQRQFAWAAQLWGAAEALREATGLSLQPVEIGDYERSVSAARADLGEKTFAAAWLQGRFLTPEQALAAKGQKPVPTSATGARSATHPAGLTAREVEVLRLLAGGLTDLQIAGTLIVSPRTVHAHISSIYSKLGITSRSAATRYALEHHLA